MEVLDRTLTGIPRAQLEALLLHLVALLGEGSPVIRFANGVEFDLESNRVILTEPTHIHARETLKITTDKHLILNSGQTQVPGKPEGYPYGIWENTQLDENGDPILLDIDLGFFETVEFGDTPVRF